MNVTLHREKIDELNDLISELHSMCLSFKQERDDLFDEKKKLMAVFDNDGPFDITIKNAREAVKDLRKVN